MATTWADHIFKCNFANEDVSISIKIPRNFVPKDPINNKWSLIQVMARHQFRQQTIPSTIDDPVEWHMYANELISHTQPLIVNYLIWLS